MQRKTVLKQAREFYSENKERIENGCLYNLCWDVMDYLERNVKTKGLQASLYKYQFDFMVKKVNSYKEKGVI